MRNLAFIQHLDRENPLDFAPPAPRLRRGAGALCLVPPSASPDGLAPALREPPCGVSLRSSASPSGSASLCRWSCFAGLGTLRFPRRLRQPVPVCLRRRRTPFGSPCRLGKPLLPVANARAALVFPRFSGSLRAPPAAPRQSHSARRGARPLSVNQAIKAMIQ